MIKYSEEKRRFSDELSKFAESLEQHISYNGEWNIKGFIDVFKNIYTISSDTKVISKIIELHLFPHFSQFAESIGYSIELADYQNWYPDLTFVNSENSDIKFAVDVKTTYVDANRIDCCKGFTLGSHGEYFINRDSSKNIKHPYNSYSGHYCLGIIYSRAILTSEFECHKYSIQELDEIPSVINQFIFFAQEKWKIASDKSGSGNTANIGSIKMIGDLVAGNGVFAKAGEEIFDDYWSNYGKIQIEKPDGSRKPMTSFEEYIKYRGLSPSINNKKNT
jgi:hypothetical protein